MQNIASSSPEQTSEHLSPVAAKMMLAAFPDRIQRSLLAHAAETGYPIEMVLKMAIAGFLDSECINFADCNPEYV
ncbi:hypothetical protein ACKFKG_29380 [Phormidesmis sp. 146-35]